MPMPSPLFRGLRPVTRAGIARDALAGVSLASMNIPQVLGYARIAGMPLVTGLYTVVLPLIAFATFGSSRHLVVSADSATAVIFASRLSSMAPSASAHYVELVGMVAVLTAGLLLLARIFKLGFLADFLSRTVLVGFLAGVGIQVGVAMLGDMLGISTAHADTIEQIRIVARSAAMTNRTSLLLSATVVAVILVCKRWLPRAPAALLVVIGSIAVSYFLDLAGRGIPVVGVVPEGLPSLAVPKFDRHELLALLPVAASCFVVIVAQSAAAARAFAERHHERFDENADILGLSAANLAAAFSGTFVVNGSPTQTAMADRAGAGSQAANLVSAATVVLVLLFFTRPLMYLPHCVLASIVFTIAVGMIDLKRLRDMRVESPGEFTLAILTAAAVAFVGVEQGILLAIALSLLRHVSHSYKPHTSVLATQPEGLWQPVDSVPGVQTEPGLIVYRFNADLFYANDNRFSDQVRELVEHAPVPVRWFVVDAGAITDIDYSAARTVLDLCAELKSKSVRLVFARVTPYLRADMDRHGLTAALGEGRIFATLHEALSCVRGDSPVPAVIR